LEEIERFALIEKISYSNHAELAKSEKVVELITGEIEECNAHLSNFETIKKFAIVEKDFSIESGELTPTMKVKRKVVVEKYRNILDSFYS